MSRSTSDLPEVSRVRRSTAAQNWHSHSDGAPQEQGAWVPRPEFLDLELAVELQHLTRREDRRMGVEHQVEQRRPAVARSGNVDHPHGRRFSTPVESGRQQVKLARLPLVSRQDETSETLPIIGTAPSLGVPFGTRVTLGSDEGRFEQLPHPIGDHKAIVASFSSCSAAPCCSPWGAASKNEREPT